MYRPSLQIAVLVLSSTTYAIAHLLAKGIVWHGGLIVGAVAIAALLLSRNHLSLWLD